MPAARNVYLANFIAVLWSGEKPGAAHRGWGSKKSAQAISAIGFRKGNAAPSENRVRGAERGDRGRQSDVGLLPKSQRGLMFCCRTARLDASRAMKSKELTGVGYPSATCFLYDRFGKGAIDCSES